MKISRVFFNKQFHYNTEEIVCYSISGHDSVLKNYYILQFKTKDGQNNSIVSYELRHFDKLAKWFESTGIKQAYQAYISPLKFVQQEYGSAFLVSVLLIGGLMLFLKFSFSY